jgi:hypothetical protein
VDLIPFPLLVLAGVLFGLALAAPVSAFARWRRGERLSRVVGSAALFAIVGFQLAVGLLLIDVTWPFTGYPMYAPRVEPGATMDVLLLSGTTRRDEDVAIAGAGMFSDPLDLQARALPALRDPATQATMAAYVLRYYNAAQSDPHDQLVALRGDVERRSIAGDGSVSRVLEPLFVYRPEAP